MNPLEVHGSHQCCDSVVNDGKVFKPIKFCSSYSQRFFFRNLAYTGAAAEERADLKWSAYTPCPEKRCHYIFAHNFT